MTVKQNSTALVIVDVQKDFCPGGALAVPEGDRVIGPINLVVHRFENLGLPIFLTRDWHPPNHRSFQEFGGDWPAHCIAGSDGADFHPNLHVPARSITVSKAVMPSEEAYSGFQGTDLGTRLRSLGVRDVVIAGLATDYCVKATALDALKAGFRVRILRDGIAAVEVRSGDGARAIDAVTGAGAMMVSVEEALDS